MTSPVGVRQGQRGKEGILTSPPTPDEEVPDGNPQTHLRPSCPRWQK